MMIQVSGQAMRLARRTQRRNSPVSIRVISGTEAPKTLRIPISRVLRSAENEARPKSPRQAIKIARREDRPKTRPKRLSASYWPLNSSSRKAYSRGCPEAAQRFFPTGYGPFQLEFAAILIVQ
jgi:hypothetical protein